MSENWYRDRKPESPIYGRGCSTTHHTGCACHEARRDEEVATLRAEVERLRADLAVEQQRSAGLRLMLAERGTMTTIQYAEKLRAELEEERLQHDHATAAAAELREVCRKRRRWSALWHREARRLWREVQDLNEQIQDGRLERAEYR